MFVLYNRYIVRFHLVEKLFAYYLYNSDKCNLFVDFLSVAIQYNDSSIWHSNKIRQLVLHLFYAFFLEKIVCGRVKPCFVRRSIANFKIVSGQLLGFAVYLHRIKYLYNFICQYLLYNILSDKGFQGIVFLYHCFNFNYGFINLIVNNLYSFPIISMYFERINEFIPNCQMTFSVSISLSTKNILGILMFFSHLQVPLRSEDYYTLFNIE